jgi:hypothetical protein
MRNIKCRLLWFQIYVKDGRGDRGNERRRMEERKIEKKRERKRESGPGEDWRRGDF